MSFPKVSIVIPIYCSEKYLSDCLDSVVNQTYPNIEIVCVDDGSMDSSYELVMKYAENYNNIRVFQQDNCGVIATRNRAIEEATGEYILPLDSDDFITHDCVEKLYKVIAETGCDVAAPSVEFCGENEGKYELPDPSPENMAQTNCIVNCALFEKRSWEKYGGYDELFDNGLEDYDFWWNFLQDNKEIIKTPEILFFYRIKNESESRNLQTGQYHEGQIRLIMEKYPRMKKIHKKVRRKRSVRTKINRAILMGKRIRNIFEWRDYKNYVLNQQLDKSDFKPIAKDSYSGSPQKKLIAYYLPQYYQIPQNDDWFGRGFTEWTNCAKAVPQYTGHWQPHLPFDVGFYNLETTVAMHRQVELARMYGIYGFCYYYYWFSGGEKIMEKPLNNMLEDKSLDFPFMLFWANEDWTNNWGEPSDLGEKIYSAKMNPDDAEAFVDDILPFFEDDRYITIDGRPHLIIYQAMKDPFLPEFIFELKRLVVARGIQEPFISLVFPDESPGSFDPLEFGADAAVEFGVHMKVRPDHVQEPVKKLMVNPAAKMTIFDMEEFINKRKFNYSTDFQVFKGAMTTYDNTARKIYTGAYMFSLSPELYEEWLRELIEVSETEYIFLTAWNEWAEGMHLEPDLRFGYSYLQATRDALEYYDQKQK